MLLYVIKLRENFVFKMASPAKKLRKANFSPAEISVLTEKFEENMEILQSKFTNSITNTKKNKIWEAIAEAVNAVGVTARTTQEVRDKWKNLHSSAKKDFSSFKREHKKTGGGPAPPAPTEASLKIINLFQDTPSFTGLQGFETGKFNLMETLYTSRKKKKASQCAYLASKSTSLRNSRRIKS